jgi:hypothetical protein
VSVGERDKITNTHNASHELVYAPFDVCSARAFSNKVIDGGEMGLFMALYSTLCINLQGNNRHRWWIFLLEWELRGKGPNFGLMPSVCNSVRKTSKKFRGN